MFIKDGNIIFKRRARARNSTENKQQSRISQYISKRKHYIIYFFILYMLGLFAGLYILNLQNPFDKAELKTAADEYYLFVDSAEMSIRILSNTGYTAAFALLAYLSGLTIFSPVTGALFCIYKGLTFGYSFGIYLYGSVSVFSALVCAVILIFSSLFMLFFILSCGEAMGYSMYILNSGETYRNALSLPNLTAYSSRHAVFLITEVVLSILPTIVVPLIYTAFF